jgi:xylulokinase
MRRCWGEAQLFLGIDVGTSGVKAVLVDGDQRLVDQATAPLDVSRPRPRWSEQVPDAWWRAVCAAMAELKSRRGRELGGVRGIGLSGQMHGATLLDGSDRVLRPAILWNDGRSAEQCAELERREPRLREITGNLAMPGFTAPKLLWVARHEPEIFARVARVLLPKDYVRLRMTGVHASDLSDSAGTLWLDVGARTWSPAMIEATGLPLSAMPELFEGSAATGTLLPAVAAEWGVPRDAVVAAGGGDNAAGAVGVGAVEPGSALMSLGTSGVIFVAGDRFRPNPDEAVHAFCHALPERWHQMSVILSAASCLTWVARATGAGDESTALAEAEAAGNGALAPIFLPYLSGERTPHNDPAAMGVFFGLTHGTGRGDLVRAVLEGVAFAFADALRALERGGSRIDRISVIGGGSRSDLWGGILAAALDRSLIYRSGGDLGPAFGAARLGRLAATGEAPGQVCSAPPVDHEIAPDPDLAGRQKERLERYRRLYRTLRPVFSDAFRTEALGDPQ